MPGFDALENLLAESLKWIHATTGLSWGWSIVLLTMGVRVAILPITIKQTRSTLAMQRLSPYVKQLQERYRHDRQELNAKMLEFYRDNKVNPFGSCLPLILQIPIMLALFYVLKDFGDHIGKVDQSDLHFMFGRIEDITDKTRSVGIWGVLLLLIYFCAQFLAGKSMMTSPDPRQKVIMYAMPFLFTPFILAFPVGVGLYWITTTLWNWGQYKVVVALTTHDREIVMPADTKGRKKTVGPKGGKDSKGAGGKPGAGGTPRSSSGQGNSKARRNKRRR